MNLKTPEPLEAQNVKPFLRWAGGKRWFIKYLQQNAALPKFKNYHEPFVGSAAVFIHLKPDSSFLSDLNSELIETYIAVKEDVEQVLKHLRSFKNTEETYYKIRQSRFKSDFKTAARFIYLNQTSFNGIYRVNRDGVYNVPFGFRSKNFFEPDNLRLVSSLLRKTEISTADFEIVNSRVKKGDLVFLDPPYTVSHNNNGFINYNQKLFSLEDQYRLSSIIDEIKKKKAYYVLTNAAHKKIEEIFLKGDKKMIVQRASTIGGTNSKRRQIDEFVFTNIDL